MMFIAPACAFAQPAHHRRLLPLLDPTGLFPSEGSPKLAFFTPQSSHMRWLGALCSATPTAAIKSFSLNLFLTCSPTSSTMACRHTLRSSALMLSHGFPHNGGIVSIAISLELT
jgi:hypothetical protein